MEPMSLLQLFLNNPEWALVVVGIFTLIVIALQTVATAQAAKATRRAAEATEASAKATETAAIAAQRNSEVLINSERAWILAELGWPKGDALHISENTRSYCTTLRKTIMKQAI